MPHRPTATLPLLMMCAMTFDGPQSRGELLRLRSDLNLADLYFNKLNQQHHQGKETKQCAKSSRDF